MARVTIKQHDVSDCGAACLASVAAHYELLMPIARIRQFACTDEGGTTVLGLMEAAARLGFDAKGVRGDMGSLPEIPKPAIAHILVQGGLQHYVVLYKLTKKYITLMDPADGRLHHRSHASFKSQWTGVLLLLIPNEKFRAGNERISVLRRFWFLLRPHSFIVIQAFTGAVIYTLLGFSTSIYIQKLTDFIFIGGNTNLLNLMSVAMLALLLLQTLIGCYKDLFLIKTGQLIDLRLILGYYKHLLQLPQPFFDRMQVGEILSRIGDAVKIRNFINGVSLSLTVNLLIVFFSFGLMFALYWELALIMFLMVPLYALVYFIVNRWNRKTEREVMETAANLESQLVESLHTIRTIKHFGLEQFANIKTETRFIRLLQQGYRSALNNVFSITGTSFVSSLFTIILLWTGSYFVIRRAITPGELMSFYAILGYFTGPVSRLIHANKDVQNALIAADRLFEIMDLEREAPQEVAPVARHSPGDIHFKGVSFRYGTRFQVFKNLTLLIPRGKVTAIVGESGSGKSTLVNLLQKLYPIQHGTIYIGDTDLAYLDTGPLRDRIALVPQEIHLFKGSVTENIAVGSFYPRMADILDLCRMLGLMPFIEGLPQGFATQIGENGARLSGGQKQRIAIARALYKNPEVLILDEATSSLDGRAERFILDTVGHLRTKGITVVLIAHRLSTVVQADKIVILDRGQVIEEGTHKELFGKKSHYFRLWQQQLPPRVPIV